MIELEQAIEIFEKYGIKAVPDNNNRLVISHYCQPKGTTFTKLGINEDELIQHVAICEGRFDTAKSALTTFPLDAVSELRMAIDTKISEFPNLRAVGTFIVNNHLKKAPKLKTIGSAALDGSLIKSLPKLKEAGILTIQNSKLEELPALEKAEKLCIIDSPVSDLKKLEFAQDIFICSTDENNKLPLIALNSLAETENLFVANTDLKSLPKLKIAKKIALYNCEIKSFKGVKNAEVEIQNHISDEELNDKFDTFTDWYNSSVLNNSMNLLGEFASTL